MKTLIAEKIDYVLNNIKGKTISPKAGSVLSLASGVLIDPASKEFQEATSLVANTLSKELDFYKTKVIPTIHAVTEYTEKFIDEKVVEKTPNNPTIVQFSIPQYIKTMIDRGTLNKSTLAQLGNVSISLSVPEDITQYTLYGKGEVGIYVKEFVATRSNDWFLSLWNKYLTNMTLDNVSLFKLLNNITSYEEDTMDDLYGLYILVKQLIANPYDKANVSLSEYTNGLVLLEKKIANAILQKADVYIKQLEANIVIAYTDTETNIIVVNDVNYLKAFEVGVEIESLFGVFIKKY